MKGISPFKMHKIIFFPEKNNLKKYVCLPYLKFSDMLLETLIYFFNWPTEIWIDWKSEIHILRQLVELQTCGQEVTGSNLTHTLSKTLYLHC